MLHVNNAKVIFLVDPNQKRLAVVVKNAPAGGPKSAGVRRLQKSVAFLEQKVVVDQLLLIFLVHSGQRIIFSLQIAGEAHEDARNFLFHFFVLGFG